MSSTTQDSKPVPRSGSFFQLAALFVFIVLAAVTCLVGRNYYQKYMEDYEMQNSQGLKLLDENRLEQAYMEKLRQEMPEESGYSSTGAGRRR